MADNSRNSLSGYNLSALLFSSEFWFIPLCDVRSGDPMFKSHCHSHCTSFLRRPVWARGRCRISPPRFLAECCKRQLNQVSLVLLYFRLSAFSDLHWVCLSVFSCTVLFVSISQVIGCEDRLRNDLYCVGWGVKLYSNHQIRFLLRLSWKREPCS